MINLCFCLGFFRNWFWDKYWSRCGLYGSWEGRKILNIGREVEKGIKEEGII